MWEATSFFFIIIIFISMCIFSDFVDSYIEKNNLEIKILKQQLK